MNISEFGINQALKTLGVNKNNLGSSTGSNFFASGENIQSFSPVDGELIGTVQATTRKIMKKLLKLHLLLLNNGGTKLHLKEVK
jgi:aldehyde dehydrogenase (NAD+)